MHRLAVALAWVLLVFIAFGPLAPAEARPDQWAWVLRLLSGDWAGENPLVVAEFQLMGLWPALFALLLRGEWRARPVPAWPFLLGSVALGCFALLPYFTLRRAGPVRAGPSRLAAAAAGALGLAGAALIAWGAAAGDGGAFLVATRADPFLWAMGFDFLAFSLLFAVVSLGSGARGAAWSAIPIVGSAIALVARDYGSAASSSA